MFAQKHMCRSLRAAHLGGQPPAAAPAQQRGTRGTRGAALLPLWVRHPRPARRQRRCARLAPGGEWRGRDARLRDAGGEGGGCAGGRRRAKGQGRGPTVRWLQGPAQGGGVRGRGESSSVITFCKRNSQCVHGKGRRSGAGGRCCSTGRGAQRAGLLRQRGVRQRRACWSADRWHTRAHATRKAAHGFFLASVRWRCAMRGGARNKAKGCLYRGMA